MQQSWTCFRTQTLDDFIYCVCFHSLRSSSLSPVTRTASMHSITIHLLAFLVAITAVSASPLGLAQTAPLVDQPSDDSATTTTATAEAVTSTTVITVTSSDSSSSEKVLTVTATKPTPSSSSHRHLPSWMFPPSHTITSAEPSSSSYHHVPPYLSRVSTMSNIPRPHPPRPTKGRCIGSDCMTASHFQGIPSLPSFFPIHHTTHTTHHRIPSLPTHHTSSNPSAAIVPRSLNANHCLNPKPITFIAQPPRFPRGRYGTHMTVVGEYCKGDKTFEVSVLELKRTKTRSTTNIRTVTKSNTVTAVVSVTTRA